MADAMEPFWQNMDEKTADKFARPERHPLVAARPLDPVVLVCEGDAAGVRGDEAAIGDRNAVGVARKVR